MVERKLERDRVRPFHPLVHAVHPARDEGGTRLRGVSSVRKDAGPSSNLAGAPQGVPGGSSRDPSTSVERRSGPRTRVSTVRPDFGRTAPCDTHSAGSNARWNLLLRGHDERLNSGRRDEPFAPMAGERIPNRTVGPRATRKRGRNGAKLSHRVISVTRVHEGGGWRARSSAFRDAGAPRARRIHCGSNPAVEGPRRGPKPREGRLEGRWKRRFPVRTHLRSNASKVMPHAVPMRASMPVTVATERSRLRGKRTSRRQRSWRHDAAAGGGHSPKGMKRAVGTRRPRDRQHPDFSNEAGVGCRSHPGRREKHRRTPGSAAGCNKPVSPARRLRSRPAFWPGAESRASGAIGGGNRRDRAKR